MHWDDYPAITQEKAPRLAATEAESPKTATKPAADTVFTIAPLSTCSSHSWRTKNVASPERLIPVSMSSLFLVRKADRSRCISHSLLTRLLTQL